MLKGLIESFMDKRPPGQTFRQRLGYESGGLMRAARLSGGCHRC